MGLDDQPERLAGLKFTGSTSSVGVAVKWDLRVLEQRSVESGKWKEKPKSEASGSSACASSALIVPMALGKPCACKTLVSWPRLKLYMDHGILIL